MLIEYLLCKFVRKEFDLKLSDTRANCDEIRGLIAPGDIQYVPNHEATCRLPMSHL